VFPSNVAMWWPRPDLGKGRQLFNCPESDSMATPVRRMIVERAMTPAPLISQGPAGCFPSASLVDVELLAEVGDGLAAAR